MTKPEAQMIVDNMTKRTPRANAIEAMNVLGWSEGQKTNMLSAIYTEWERDKIV